MRHVNNLPRSNMRSIMLARYQIIWNVIHDKRLFELHYFVSSKSQIFIYIFSTLIPRFQWSLTWWMTPTNEEFDPSIGQQIRYQSYLKSISGLSPNIDHDIYISIYIYIYIYMGCVTWRCTRLRPLNDFQNSQRTKLLYRQQNRRYQRSCRSYKITDVAINK